jgi:hypothetical protein
MAGINWNKARGATNVTVLDEVASCLVRGQASLVRTRQRARTVSAPATAHQRLAP